MTDDRIELYHDEWFDVVQSRHGRFFASGPAVAVVAVDDDSAYWLVEEPAPAAGTRAIVAVTGAIEAGENVIEAADRELREELDRAADRIVHIGTIRPWVKYLDVVVDVCVALGLRPDDSGAVGDEAVPPEPVRFTPKQFDEAVAAGRVVDGTTIAAVAIVRRWLDDRPVSDRSISD